MWNDVELLSNEDTVLFGNGYREEGCSGLYQVDTLVRISTSDPVIPGFPSSVPSDVPPPRLSPTDTTLLKVEGMCVAGAAGPPAVLILRGRLERGGRRQDRPPVRPRLPDRPAAPRLR